MLSGSQNVEVFNVRVSDRLTYYCKEVDWWDKYESPVLLFVPKPFILS